MTARVAHKLTAGLCAVAASLAGPLMAAADPPPNCTAADLAGVATGVSAATSSYLFTHPDVNDFFTGLKGLPKDQVRQRAQQYLEEIRKSRPICTRFVDHLAISGNAARSDKRAT